MKLPANYREMKGCKPQISGIKFRRIQGSGTRRVTNQVFGIRVGSAESRGTLNLMRHKQALQKLYKKTSYLASTSGLPTAVSEKSTKEELSPRTAPLSAVRSLARWLILSEGKLDIMSNTFNDRTTMATVAMATWFSWEYRRDKTGRTTQVCCKLTIGTTKILVQRRI